MMHKFDYWSPTEVVCGKGREDETAAYVKKYGGSKVLLVYGGGSVERSGLLQRVKEQLDAAGIGYAEFGGVQPNPTVEYAREGVKRAIESQADFILAAQPTRMWTFGSSGLARRKCRNPCLWALS